MEWRRRMTSRRDLRSLSAAALATCATAALAACDRPRPATEPSAAGRASGGEGSRLYGYSEAPPPPRQDTTSPTTGSVRIDERILRACGDLPEPYFAIDSAAIRDEAANRLRTVARCFTTGPLRGRKIKLVGRADPRGTEIYNLALGQDRAASVGRFLESAGVPTAHIRTMSRGEIDATGTDEHGWTLDRRVDILLGD